MCFGSSKPGSHTYNERFPGTYFPVEGDENENQLSVLLFAEEDTSHVTILPVVPQRSESSITYIVPIATARWIAYYYEGKCLTLSLRNFYTFSAEPLFGCPFPEVKVMINER